MFFFPILERFTIPTPFSDSIKALGGLGFHEDDPVAFFAEARFKQQRHVQDDRANRRVGAGLVHLLLDFGFDDRMDQALEFFSLVILLKNQFGQTLPIRLLT